MTDDPPPTAPAPGDSPDPPPPAIPPAKPELAAAAIANTALEPLEVVPDSAGATPPQLNPVEGWLLRNIAPLFVICLGLTIQSAIELARPHLPKPTPNVSNPGPAASAQEAISKLEVTPLHYVMGLISIGGALFCISLLIAAAADEQKRAWLFGFLKDFAVRPLPALRFMDVAAAIIVLQTAAGSLGLLLSPLRQGFQNNGGAQRALGLVLGAASMGAAIATGIMLARRRAGGPHGSHGFWPFWTPAWTSQPRSVWQDVMLGLVCYPLMLWVVHLSLHVNRMLVQYAGRNVDENAILTDLAQKQSVWVLAIYIVAATAGAAFLEEILFRGMLYNMLRRYLGPVAGGAGAALLFALAHGVWSQVLALFFLALILTWLYDRTGRLIASMTLHAVNNLVSLLVVLYFSR